MPSCPHDFTHLHDLHRWYAALDAPDPRPHVAAFTGEHPVVLVGLRHFPPGGHRGPLVEALALALPLGADRVSVALTGRAWSLDDPVVPVAATGDLRQRVLAQVTADGHRRSAPRVTTRLHPFHVPADRPRTVVWQPALDPGASQGWVPDALAAMVAARHRVRGEVSDDDLARQLGRLHHLGHQVRLSDHVAASLPPEVSRRLRRPPCPPDPMT